MHNRALRVYQLKCTNPVLTEQPVEMLSFLRDAVLCVLRAAQGPPGGGNRLCHGTLFLLFSQCSPCRHPSATEEATQVTYKGNESLTKEGEKAKLKLLVEGEAVVENCWGKAGLWPSRQEAKIRIAQARRLWHTEEWITGLEALEGN